MRLFKLAAAAVLTTVIATPALADWHHHRHGWHHDYHRHWHGHHRHW